MKDIQEIVKKADNGEHINDYEVDQAAKFFAKVSDDLLLLGDKFHLAWKEAHYYKMKFDGMSFNRRNKTNYQVM